MLSVPVIVSDTLSCLGSSGTGAPFLKTASVLENTSQGSSLSVGSISVMVTHFAKKCVEGPVRCAATGGYPLEVFLSMWVPYPSPFLSMPTGCEGWAGPTGWPPPEVPPALTALHGVAVPFRSLESEAAL